MAVDAPSSSNHAYLGAPGPNRAVLIAAMRLGAERATERELRHLTMAIPALGNLQGLIENVFGDAFTCGVHEGTYLLDVVAAHSDIQPTELHGDTHAQSYTVFGLAHLLGFDLMPRIRGVKDYKLHRADDKSKFKNILSLLDKTPIKWDLIETHFRDLMRIVVSIKRGIITPSTILRRLGTQSRKNKLYFALRELGKAVRTRFLLRYIASLDLRERIHAATNKNEQYHHFAKSIAFGNGGVIADNLRHEQLKVIRYNNLAANLLMILNVEHMSRIITELQQEGHEVTEEHLAGLAPYSTQRKRSRFRTR